MLLVSFNLYPPRRPLGGIHRKFFAISRYLRVDLVSCHRLSPPSEIDIIVSNLSMRFILAYLALALASAVYNGHAAPFNVRSLPSPSLFVNYTLVTLSYPDHIHQLNSQTPYHRNGYRQPRIPKFKCRGCAQPPTLRTQARAGQGPSRSRESLGKTSGSIHGLSIPSPARAIPCHERIQRLSKSPVFHVGLETPMWENLL